jgi:hypothetical protein
MQYNINFQTDCPTECATINDLILGKDQVTPENQSLTVRRGFFYRLVSPPLFQFFQF